MKISKILLTLSLVLVASSCEKNREDLVDPNPIPDADPANNVCVITQYVGPTDELSEACGSKSYLPEYDADRARDNMANALARGINGTKYTVLDKGWKSNGSVSCSGGGMSFAYMKSATAWVKYDCRGIAVDVKIYGPYPASALTVKIAQHTAEIEAEGYKIAYISQDRVSNDSNIYYLTFFVYKEDAKNAKQAAVVAALQSVRFSNKALTGKANLPLQDSLNVAARNFPELDKRQDFKSAETLVNILQTIRSQRKATLQ